MRQLQCAALALVLSVGVAGGIAGCSDVLTGGAVSYSSYPPVSALPVAELSTALPVGFPKGIPVIEGKYRRLTSSSLGAGAFVLAVGNTGEHAVQRARDRLVAAGFVEQEILGQKAYVGKAHTVVVAPVDEGYGFSLLYTITRTQDFAGLPDLDLTDLFGP